MSDYDLLVVGGGVNGVGVARDAAGRGLSVLLCEKDDLAQHTSSWSTKLIHGGLRYLEQYEFRLVREALIEREVLLEAAPHLVRPLRFILPHHKGLRPRFVLRLGLWLYDRLGGRKVLPATTTIDLARDPRGAPLTDAYAFGFEYTDCAVDDSRLVAVNAVDARRRGATVLTRTEVIGGRRDGARWRCAIRDEAGVERRVTARAIVNAAGPWVSGLFDRIDGPEPKKRLRLVKGSHIVTRRLYDHDRAYIFQNSDGRVVFAIPWTGDTTLLGTTDEAFEGEPAAAAISEAEIDYILGSVNAYFAEKTTREDVVWTFSGVRPLFDDMAAKTASAVTRDYAFDVDRGADDRAAPLLSIYGGKLTTYRKLAEHAMEKLAATFPSAGPAWTREASLPGGESGYARWPETVAALQARYGFLDAAVFDRMVGAYGEALVDVLGDAQSCEALGRDFGGGLYAREVDYLCAHEFARTADDILWRRTKLGLSFSDDERRSLTDYLAERRRDAA